MFFLALLFACLAVAWMSLLPYAVTRLVRARTGFGMEIQTLYINPFTAKVTLRGLVIMNPPAFPRKDFVEVREFRADARLFSLFGRRPVINEAVINVAAVTIVRDPCGVVNTSLFQEGLAGRTPPSAGPPADPGQKKREFLIKRLQVRCDRLVIADYSRRRPEVSEFNLNFSHVYENVTSTRQLVAPLAEILSPVAAVFGDIFPEAGTVLRTAGDAMKKTGRKTGEAVKGFFEALEKILKK
jgi:hypothetical protein